MTPLTWKGKVHCNDMTTPRLVQRPSPCNMFTDVFADCQMGPSVRAARSSSQSGVRLPCNFHVDLLLSAGQRCWVRRQRQRWSWCPFVRSPFLCRRFRRGGQGDVDGLGLRGLVFCSGEISPHRKHAHMCASESEMDTLCRVAGIAGLRP